MNLSDSLDKMVKGFYASSQGKIWIDFLNTYLSEPAQFLDRFSSDLPASSRIIDLGCGEAQYLVKLLANRTNDDSYWIGVDISSENLHKAIENARMSRQKHKMDFIQSTIDHLPFKEGTFDGILIRCALHHLTDLASIKEFYKITREKRRLLIIDLPGANPIRFLERKIGRYIGSSVLGYGHRFLFFTPTSLERVIHEAGFEIIQCNCKDFFLRRLANTFFFFPPLRFIIKWKILLSLYRIEKRFEQSWLFNEFCACIYLYCT